MPAPAVILREIHRLRRFAKDLQTKIDQGPRTLKAQQARVARQEDILRQAQEGLKRLKVTIHDKEVTLRTALQQITKHEKQQNEAASKKDAPPKRAPSAKDVSKSGAPKQSKAQARAPVRRTSPRGKGSKMTLQSPN